MVDRTGRSRDDASASVQRYSASFASEAPLLPTTELVEKLKRGDNIILVDVREVEEQKVSMIPGAMTKSVFESEVLPGLLQKKQETPDNVKIGSSVVAPDEPDEERTEPLVVPYCTVGYRSGVYCRELQQQHRLKNVRNGEGVVMWTFDGGPLAKPLSTGRAPQLPWNPSDTAGNRQESADATYTVHVYGRPWDMAAQPFKTVYYPPSTIAVRQIRGRCCNQATVYKLLWVWAFVPWYLFLTPACGVMYHCGCQLALSKWGQLETCNVYDPMHHTRPHLCPWCNCAGPACMLVGSDTRAFRGIFLLDLLPDGCFVTVLTVLVLLPSWNALDKLGKRPSFGFRSISLCKALLAAIWFAAYALAMGGIFFAGTTDYPFFLGYERKFASRPTSFDHLQPLPGRLLITPNDLHSQLSNWVVVDVRNSNPQGGVLPGAVALSWAALGQGGDTREGRLSTLLPVAEVAARLAAVGINSSRQVAVYGDWNFGWGEEGWLFWTLEYLGFDLSRIACLQGGIPAWRAAGFPLQAEPSAVVGSATAAGTSVDEVQERRATTAWVQQNLARTSRVVLLDTRDRSEFDGTAAGDAYGAARSGHIPGSHWWPWQDRIFQANSGALRNCTEILNSLPSWSPSADEIVAYCTGGIRSGFAYLALRGCGLGQPGELPRLRNYEASWWAWASDSTLRCEGSGPGCQSQAVQLTHGGSGAGGF